MRGHQPGRSRICGFRSSAPLAEGRAEISPFRTSLISPTSVTAREEESAEPGRPGLRARMRAANLDARDLRRAQKPAVGRRDKHRN